MKQEPIRCKIQGGKIHENNLGKENRNDSDFRGDR